MQRSCRLGGTSTAAEVTRGLDLRGKAIVLTGCSSGIGLETFRVLVKRGAHVIGLARNAEKVERASSIARASDGGGKTTALACELEDFRSVVECAAAVRNITSRVDALICNAGIEVGSLQRIGGIEKQFLVNHLSHFVLVNRLLGLLKAAQEGRVVVVSSCFAYMRAPPEGIQFANLSGEGGYERDVHMLYAQSKLANVLFPINWRDILKVPP